MSGLWDSRGPAATDVGPIGSLDLVVLDTPDPFRSAAFYVALLGWTVGTGGTTGDASEEWVTLRGPAGSGMAFQRVADYRPPTWPDDAVPQQVHLDVAVSDLDEAERRVLAIGAIPTGLPDRAGAAFRVYLDPVGHPFCLCTGD